jgi:hypothetical protein
MFKIDNLLKDYFLVPAFRVISRGYFEGIEGNLRILPHHYPGWTIRLYLDLSIAHQELKGSYIFLQ